MRLPKIKANWLDRAINHVAPVWGTRRMRARMFLAMTGGYTGARKDRRSLKEWNPFGGDADSDILPDLPALRDRSRDLVRNNPIASGAISSKLEAVIGATIALRPHVDREVLGLDDDGADAWERRAGREWRLFWGGKDCDVARTSTGIAICRMAYQQSKENGDVLGLLPNKIVPGFPYGIKVQLVEADRLCNPSMQPDSDTLAEGVEKDADGAPKYYHIAKYHPGAQGNVKGQSWRKIPAFGAKTGLRNVIHLYNPTRPGQTRGVPDLAPVIEPLKQLGRYTETELMAAVVAGLFTVFIEREGSPLGGGGLPSFNTSKISGETDQQGADKDLKLGNGMIVDLAAGEKINTANPGRPNAAFDPFVNAIFTQIGVGLNIPKEILLRVFDTSYTAARAAINEYWRYVMSERRWFFDNFLSLVYERWMWEAVAIGRLPAPGFFADPIIRMAWLGTDLVGPVRGQIQELTEVKAAGERIDRGMTTLAIETANLTGGDWEKNHEQQVREHHKRKEGGLISDETKSV